MPEYHVEKSTLIDAPLTSVQALTNDFSQWPRWSPWLCMEPDVNVEVVGTPGDAGHGFSWQGNLTGAGQMETLAHDNNLHRMNLNFIKPFKSKAAVSIELLQQGAHQTRVTWRMDSALPFFLFFMTNSIKTMIGMDYERGLRMLKDCAEAGKVDSNTEIEGVVTTRDIHYVGLSADATLNDIGSSMEQTMAAIYKTASESQLKFTDIPAGAIYDNMDLKRQQVRYTAMIPVSTPATATNDMTVGTLPAGKAIKVVHTGSYRHLGNGWAAAMSYQRYNKLKPLKSQPPYEVYLNDPQTTDEKDLLTEIYIPLRS